MLILVCTLLLVAGFFFAGRQHFSSMDYGMKNSRLRKQVDELQAEKRRLLLAREIAMSPSEIKKAVKKIGLTDIAEGEVELAKATSLTKGKPIVATGATSIASKPMIVKTASVMAAPASVAAMYPKSEKNGKPATVKRATTTATE
jgi:hypothetical protein